MTREEAVQNIAKAGNLSIEHAEDLYDSIIPKPTVPQYVADWYEEHKDNYYTNLHCTILEMYESLNPYSFAEITLNHDFKIWYYNNKNSIQILVNMHQFGYEVEEEKRYTVRIRNLDDEATYLNYDKFRETWVFYSRDNTDRFRTIHTRKELEEGSFDWVFDCEGVEVEEVEE